MEFRVLILLFFSCLGISFAQYPDQESYYTSPFWEMELKFRKDIKRTYGEKYKAELDSIFIQYPDSIEFKQLYQGYLDIKHKIVYSDGEVDSIEHQFSVWTNLAKRQKSVVNFLALNEVIVYYKSISRLDKLIELIELVDQMEDVISPRNLTSIRSMLYYDTFQYQKAIEQYKLNNTLNNHEFNQVSNLNNIGLAYGLLNEVGKAKLSYLEALELLDRLILDTTIVNGRYTKKRLEGFRNLIELNLKGLDGKESNVKEEIKRLRRHIQYNEDLHGVGDINSMYELARLYSVSKAYEISNNVLDSIELYMRRSAEKPNIQIKTKQLKVFNDLKLGKVDDALENLVIDREIQNREGTYGVIQKYINKKTEEEKSHYKGLIKNRNENIESLSILIVVLLVVTLIWYKKNKKEKQVVEEKADQIEKNLQKVKSENTMYVQESNHRIMNSLQLIADLVSVDYLQNKETFDLKSFQSKMTAIAEVHSILYQNNEKDEISVKVYLEQLIDYVKDMIADDIQLEMNVDETFFLNSDKIKFLGLLIVELIINSAKHGLGKDEKKIKLILKQVNQDGWLLNYQDNGHFDKNSYNETKGFGNTLIYNLIQLLEADYELKNNDGFNMVIQHQ